MIVIDASILVPALADDGPDGERCRARLAAEQLTAPEVVDLEFCSVVRKLAHRGELTAARAGAAIEDLTALPLRRVGHRSLVPRIWQLRDNLTPYDAAYVALAERLEATLITGDARLAAAPGIRCHVEHIR